MFDFRKLEITNEEIAFVESHFGFSFNEGQKKIIRFLDNTDIQACPGSGKTTTLAAKLIILANRIPKSFKQGICVITHTNVAVEEIKSKLGPYSRFFLNYPHHFGTIQSVVDKFLAIPAYKNQYKSSPIIDNESYFDLIERKKSIAVEKAKFYLSESKHIKFLGSLCFNKTNFDISSDVNDSEPVVGKHTATYATLLGLKNEILQAGYIKYEEAYSIAFKYLRVNPGLRVLFSKRFPLVFIDEMQDMENHQSELIDYLFDGTTSIVQKIGDINQSIYSHSSSEDQNQWSPKVNSELQLTETARLSDNIIQVVKDICIAPQEMVGKVIPTALNPTIILYDDISILTVKDKFGELLIENNIHQGKSCKAVGARLSDSKLNINSYWNDFNRGFKKKEFSNAKLFLEFIKQQSAKSKNVKEIRKSFLNVVCKCLRLCKVKSPVTSFYFSPFTLFQYLNSVNDSRLDDLNRSLIRWISSNCTVEEVKGEIRKYIANLVISLNGQENHDLTNFFIDSEIDSFSEMVENKVYTFKYNEDSVQIHFDTIHGVKGETHQATLYFETFNRIYDIGGKILEFIISNDKRKTQLRKNDAVKKRLPLAYVALTRATHFICIAVHKDRCTDGYLDYFKNSPQWNVVIL